MEPHDSGLVGGESGFHRKGAKVAEDRGGGFFGTMVFFASLCDFGGSAVHSVMKRGLGDLRVEVTAA